MPHRTLQLWSRRVAFTLCAVLAAGLLLGGAAGAHGRGGYSIETLSAAPDQVSGGDVLVRVAARGHARLDRVSVPRCESNRRIEHTKANPLFVSQP